MVYDSAEQEPFDTPYVRYNLVMALIMEIMFRIPEQLHTMRIPYDLLQRVIEDYHQALTTTTAYVGLHEEVRSAIKPIMELEGLLLTSLISLEDPRVQLVPSE
jgi:division protein CdvB (Snf7/Vps24/ESCRT-III family)